MKLRYSQEEFDALAAAAARAGLTPSGYAAETALSAARGVQSSGGPWFREALVEVMTARAQVRRVGSNLNQAVRVLNATGEAPEGLARAVLAAQQAVSELDAAAGQLARRVSASRRVGPEAAMGEAS